jgi:hypothetical protein
VFVWFILYAWGGFDGSVVRRRVSFVHVGMVIALVFAMSRGAYAASKFLIMSTKQIKPSVIAQLKGKAGPTGPQGSNGTTGFTKALPEGDTEKGIWS